MTINSIEYITKKHFHSLINVLVTLTAAAIAAIAAYLAFFTGFETARTAFAAFAALSAVFTLVRVFSPGAGCTLMRISVSVIALSGFIAGLEAFTLGYLLIRHSGTQSHLNELLSVIGLSIATRPEVTARLMMAGSVLCYAAAGCAFFCHRYLGAVRSCASGVLKRSGLRVFPPISAILFILCLIAAGALELLSSDHILVDMIMKDRTSMLTAILIALLPLHLLLSGINARTFSRRTFAFKVFEKQIMKVETNADGTVYVPINEDVAPGTEEEPELKKHSPAPEESRKGKPFIPEFAPSGENFSAAGEADIL